MKRIGILGGTFNPIHNGHLAIAERAREQFALEKVLFMPSGVPYMKDLGKVLPIQTRCEMTALAIRDIPGFELSRLEVEDAERGKNTYTCDTLHKLRSADPEAVYYFILGADSLYAIEEWKNPAQIFENCTVLAAVRREETEDDPRHTSACGYGGSGEDEKKRLDSLRGQAAYLREKYGAAIEILEFAGMDVSSTQLRERACRGMSLGGLVPELVEAYIRQNDLYEKNS